MGWIGCVRREKNLTRLCGTNFCTSSARFALSFVRQPNGPKWYEMHQNMSLGSHVVDQVLSLRKNPTRVRGTNFCTSSERFAPSFARQPNGCKCIKMVRNAPKHEFRVQWGGAFVTKKIRLDFVARIFALVRPVLPRVS